MTLRTSYIIVLTALLAMATDGLAQALRPAGVLIPHESWNCGMADGIPNPESGTLVFEAEMKFERTLDVGKTPYGSRQVVVAQEGSLSGAKLSGAVMPGALDFELRLSNGTIEIEQVFVLKTADGTYVYARNAGTGADSNDVRVVMDFEAPNAGPYAWLNSGKSEPPEPSRYRREISLADERRRHHHRPKRRLRPSRSNVRSADR